jgi:predicted GIY-YIG superfamily endonuclease
MRDSLDNVLYIGKARNLKKRLASYRVANPDRLRRRHLRLLRAVTRIELRECADEVSALATESELLRKLRPRFNRAGTWPAPRRFFTWKVDREGIEFAVRTMPAESPPETDGLCWHCCGPIGSSAFALQATLVRLCWCGVHPEHRLRDMPEGWFHCRYKQPILIACKEGMRPILDHAALSLEELFGGDAHGFSRWIRERTVKQIHPFEVAVKEMDLEFVEDFAAKQKQRLTAPQH